MLTQNLTGKQSVRRPNISTCIKQFAGPQGSRANYKSQHSKKSPSNPSVLGSFLNSCRDLGGVEAGTVRAKRQTS